jgi:site-specific DNA recombinase
MSSTIAIARRERVRDNYVRRLLPLAFLAPALVEAICAGRQPPELTAERLRRCAGLPLDWPAQQSWLRIAPRAAEAGSQNS